MQWFGWFYGNPSRLHMYIHVGNTHLIKKNLSGYAPAYNTCPMIDSKL